MPHHFFWALGDPGGDFPFLGDLVGDAGGDSVPAGCACTPKDNESEMSQDRQQRTAVCQYKAFAGCHAADSCSRSANISSNGSSVRIDYQSYFSCTADRLIDHQDAVGGAGRWVSGMRGLFVFLLLHMKPKQIATPEP